MIAAVLFMIAVDDKTHVILAEFDVDMRDFHELSEEAFEVNAP